MSAAIDVALDDLIKSKRIRGGGRGGSRGGRSGLNRRDGGGGGGNRGFRRSSDRPHARGGYVDLDNPDVFTVPSGGAFSGNKTVRINVSNLAPSVFSDDLEELFQSYNIESATVHYNEHGASLGTGDLFLKKRDAERLVKDFAGVALDNQVMKFLLVDSSDSLVSRVDFSGRVNGGGIQKRTSHPYSSHSRDDRRGSRFGGGYGRGGRSEGRGGRGGFNSRKRDAQPKKTQEELDADLEAYMAKRDK